MEGDTLYIYIIQLGTQKALHECKSVEINNTPKDIINWIEGNFDSDADYYNCHLTWEWITLVKDAFYACVIESEDFDKEIDDGSLTFKDVLPSNFDIVSKLITII